MNVINDVMKINDKEPNTIRHCYRVLYSNDDNEYVLHNYHTDDYNVALKWFEEVKREFPYAELTCQVVGIWDGGDEIENLGEVLIAKYVKDYEA